jgi:hypothetical protein
MEMYGEIHAWAALPPGKELSVPNRLVSHVAGLDDVEKREKSLAPALNRTPLYRLSYPDFKISLLKTIR